MAPAMIGATAAHDAYGGRPFSPHSPAELVVHLDFDTDAAAPRTARHAVVAAFSSLADGVDPPGQFAATDPLAGDIELVVSELVTNAITHARTGGAVELWHGDEWLLTVFDHLAAIPDIVRRSRPWSPVPGTSASGRGLSIVDALADRWGMMPTGDGKVVWAAFGVQALAPP